MKTRVAIFLTVLTLATGGGLSAQTAWGSPLLMPPGGGDGLGIYLIDATGGDLGAQFTYRRVSVPVGLGFRGGVAEEAGGGLSAFGGVDLAGSLVPATDEMPLDIMWVLGAGASIGSEIWFSFPAGVTVGTTVDGDGVRLKPYATPRLVLDAITNAANTLNLNFAVDLGLDLAFNDRMELRFAASVGDHEAIAAGLAVPIG